MATTGVDEVVVFPGTYVEAINFEAKAITVRSASGNPADTIIDGTGQLHVVQFVTNEGSDLVLADLIITGGNAKGLDTIAGTTLPDMALLAASWMQSDCSHCNGADFTGDGNVLLDDLVVQVANWLCGTL